MLKKSVNINYSFDQTRERLNVAKIQTIEDLNSVDFNKYTDTNFLSWVRYIVLPIKTKSLNKICKLSTEEGSKVRLSWLMGELYYKKRALPQIKVLRQTTFC